MDLLIKTFIGFADYTVLINNFWKFTAIDPELPTVQESSSPLLSATETPLFPKLSDLYTKAKNMMNNYTAPISDPDKIFDLQTQNEEIRNKLVEEWNLPPFTSETIPS